MHVSRLKMAKMDFYSLNWVQIGPKMAIFIRYFQKYLEYLIIFVQWFRTSSIFESFLWIQVSHLLPHLFRKIFASTEALFSFGFKFD